MGHTVTTIPCVIRQSLVIQSRPCDVRLAHRGTCIRYHKMYDSSIAGHTFTIVLCATHPSRVIHSLPCDIWLADRGSYVHDHSTHDSPSWVIQTRSIDTRLSIWGHTNTIDLGSLFVFWSDHPKSKNNCKNPIFLLKSIYFWVFR